MGEARGIANTLSSRDLAGQRRREKSSSFDKLRMRISPEPPAKFGLILSLSKDEDAPPMPAARTEGSRAQGPG